MTLHLLTLLAERGEVVLPGDDITLLDHSLQTAQLATRAHASPAMVVAALLHDIGHLASEHDPALTEPEADDLHEHVAAEMLGAFFGPDVVEPVRLHVPAKRYLAATDERYCARLAPMLAQSLGLQGGAMSSAEVTAFESAPWFEQAVQLRRWDDAAQVPGRPAAGLDVYADVLQAASRLRT